jgi:hypothetical protein
MSKINYSFIASHKEWSPVIEKDVYLFLVKYNGNADPVIEKDKRFYGFRWFSIEELKTAKIKPDIRGFVKKNIQYM